jgi:hypothetical protein
MPILPEQFSSQACRAWLKSLPSPNYYAGSAGERCHCPVAQWLRATTSHAEVKVDYDEVSFGGLSYEPPAWLRRFERKVDRQPDGTNIRRRQALNLLTRVERAISQGLEEDD